MSEDGQLLRNLQCAIYTRKSSEEGLEQQFNSLEAQREAAIAYVQSQRQLGWTVVETRFDDGGFSGGNPTFNSSEIVFNQDREYSLNQTGLDNNKLDVRRANVKARCCQFALWRCGRSARVCVDVRLKRFQGQMTVAGDVRSTNGWQTL